MRIGVIADSHVAVDERKHDRAAWHNPYRLVDSLDRLNAALTHELVRAADVVVVLGDLAHYGDRASVRAVIDAVNRLGVPVVLLSGNHDVIERDVHLHEEVVACGAPNVWSPLVPSVPPALTDLFERAGIGLQVVDVTAEWPTPDRPFAVEARTIVEGTAGGPGLTLTHFPLLDFRERCEGAGFLYSGHLGQLAESPDLERGWSPHVVFGGHLHVRAVTEAERALQLSFGALVEAPYEVAQVGFECGKGAVAVTLECASVRAVDEEKVPVLDPPSGTWSFSI